MDVAALLAVVRRWWLLILVATILGGVGGWIGSSASARTYESSTRLLVGPVNADFDTLRASGELAQTYANLATSDAVLAGAASAVGLATGDLREAVDARAEATSRILTVRAEADDPARAAAIANAVGESLAAYTATGAARPEGEVRVVDPAIDAADPVAPSAELIALLAALGALLAALLVVTVLELLDDRVRSIDDLRRVAGRPIAGHVASDGSILTADPASRDAASYRAAAGMLPIAGREGSIVVLADAEEGRRSGQVCVNLAAAIVGTGLSVRVVDAREGEPLDGRLVAALRGVAPSIRNGGDPRSQAPVEVVHAAEDAWQSPSALDARGDDEATTARVNLVDVGDPRHALTARAWTDDADAVVLCATIGHATRSSVREALERLASISTVPPVVLAVNRRGVGQQLAAAVPKPGARSARQLRSRAAPPRR